MKYNMTNKSTIDLLTSFNVLCCLFLCQVGHYCTVFTQYLNLQQIFRNTMAFSAWSAH